MLLGSISFFAGLVGLIGYTLFRIIETRRQQRVFEEVRRRLDAFSTRLYRLAVFGEIPASYRMSFRKAIRDLIHSMVVFLVGALRVLERRLSRLGHRLRVARTKEGEQSTPSHFIKQIVERKKEHSEKPDDSIESL